MGSRDHELPVELEQAERDIQNGIAKAHRLLDRAQPIARRERDILVEINRVVVDLPPSG